MRGEDVMRIVVVYLQICIIPTILSLHFACLYLVTAHCINYMAFHHDSNAPTYPKLMPGLKYKPYSFTCRLGQKYCAWDEIKDQAFI